MTDLSLGVSLGVSRFLGGQDAIRRSSKIKKAHLNSVEFGMLNCTIGRMTIPGVTPYPTEHQAKKIKEKFDIVIVDGRFRRRCLIEAKKILAPEGYVVLHDAHKKHYHSPLDSYKHGKFIETGFLYHETYREKVKLWIGN